MRQLDRSRQGHGLAVRRRYNRRDRLRDQHLAACHKDGRERARLAGKRLARAGGRRNEERGGWRCGDFWEGKNYRAKGGY